MSKSLTTAESINLIEIIQEKEDSFDEPCSGNIESYDDFKINIVFEFDNPLIDNHTFVVDRATMMIDD